MPPDPLLVACPNCTTLNRMPRARLGEPGKCGRCGNPLFEGRPVTLTSTNFSRHAADGDLPLLVDFWAAWCGPCRMMAPVFEEAASRLEPRVRLGKLDTEAEPRIAQRYAIQSIPSLVLIHKDREVARSAGAMPLPSLLQWAEQALGA